MPKIDMTSMFEREATRLQAFGKDGAKTIQRAVATLARRLPVEARRDMQAEYNLKASRITAGLSTRREDGAVVLTGSKRGIGLIEFGGEWGGRKTPGATAMTRKSGGASTYDSAFIATGKNGNRQMFERAAAKGRLPLRTLYGPSIADMLKNADRRARLAGIAQDVLASEINRQLGV